MLKQETKCTRLKQIITHHEWNRSIEFATEEQSSDNNDHSSISSEDKFEDLDETQPQHSEVNTSSDSEAN